MTSQRSIAGLVLSTVLAFSACTSEVAYSPGTGDTSEFATAAGINSAALDEAIRGLKGADGKLVIYDNTISEPEMQVLACLADLNRDTVIDLVDVGLAAGQMGLRCGEILLSALASPEIPDDVKCMNMTRDTQSLVDMSDVAVMAILYYDVRTAPVSVCDDPHRGDADSLSPNMEARASRDTDPLDEDSDNDGVFDGAQPTPTVTATPTPTPIPGVTPTPSPTATPTPVVNLCNNGVINAGEQCDGSLLNGQTCLSQGFSSGTLSCTSGCTFATSQCVSLVEVSGVSSVTFSHNQVITAAGSGFGAKAAAAPVIFDNFENGTNGATISQATGWDAVNGWSEAAKADIRKPFYSNVAGHKHSGNLAMTCNNSGDTGNSSVRVDADYSNGFFLDAWYQYAPANPASRNHKIFMLYGNGTNEFPESALTGFCHLDQGLEIPFYAGPGYGDADWTGLTFNHVIGQMHHLQVWIKPSTPGVYDGKTWLAVDGTVFANSSDLLTNMPGVGHWVQARVGFYNAHDTVGECGNSGDSYSYWDDVYVDSTPARIELGNHQVYAQATHREIQIPTSWSSSQVSFRVNRGTFAAGEPVYLFIVNGNNVPSNGYAVTMQ